MRKNKYMSVIKILLVAIIGSLLACDRPNTNTNTREPQTGGGGRVANSEVVVNETDQNINGSNQTQTPSSVLKQERKVLPVDEAAKDTSFLAFREKLIDASKKRDKAFILNILDTKIHNGLGGNTGIEGFKETWRFSEPKSQFWDEFLSVLNLGGSFDKDSNGKAFVAPYTFTQFPDDIPSYEGYELIIGKDVRLRAEPSLSASEITTLSYNLVKVDHEKSVGDGKEEPTYYWLKVDASGGKKGFVSAKYVRSANDYRARFEKKEGKWRMTSFLAGD